MSASQKTGKLLDVLSKSSFPSQHTAFIILTLHKEVFDGGHVWGTKQFITIALWEINITVMQIFFYCSVRPTWPLWKPSITLQRIMHRVRLYGKIWIRIFDPKSLRSWCMKEPTNPYAEWICRFLWYTNIQVILDQKSGFGFYQRNTPTVKHTQHSSTDGWSKGGKFCNALKSSTFRVIWLK